MFRRIKAVTPRGREERSDENRRDLVVENITLKAGQSNEAILRWYGHIVWIDGENMAKQTMKMEERY